MLPALLGMMTAECCSAVKAQIQCSPLGEGILIQLVVHEVRAKEPLSDGLCLRQGEKANTVWRPAKTGIS